MRAPEIVNVLGHQVELIAESRLATITVLNPDDSSRKLGVLAQHLGGDLYTSSICSDARSLFDQLELLIRRWQRERAPSPLS